MGNKMIDIEGISAVTMFVSKMDRAVDFYESLGFKVCCGGRGECYFHLRDPDGNEISFARPRSNT
jgi:predicted enzyme related to lactoylglutathione lyase